MNDKVKYIDKIYIIAIPDCCLTSSEQVFSHILGRIIYISKKDDDFSQVLLFLVSY
jgi:hypothetical protein